MARDVFGWGQLSDWQLDAIESLLRGTDTLVVAPSGSGKSAVYQLAGLRLPGPTVVVSPLIALQRDQRRWLSTVDVPKAIAISSVQTTRERQQAWDSLRAREAHYVFLTPEQLSKQEVLERLDNAAPSLLVVDEAHCVSAWGHDFRPDYLQIGEVRQRMGRPVVAALTATASPPVRQEIVRALRMVQPHRVLVGLDRPNLHLAVKQYADDKQKRAAVIDNAMQDGPGLIYVGTRKETKQYAEDLTETGLVVAAYHGGRKAADRHRIHERFLTGQLEVVVATSAFGMGIDKPDVRFVLHADIPESLDAYYQQIGRAGRDGSAAQTLLCYRTEDLGLRRYFTTVRADPDAINTVIGTIREAGEPLSVTRLRNRLELSRGKIATALNLLKEVGALRTDSRGRRHDIDPARSPTTIARQSMEAAHRHQSMEQSQLEMMRGYAETIGCRRQFLLGYFGEELPGDCGNCDNCQSRSSDEPHNAVETEFPINARVQHRSWGTGVVVRPESDRVTVLFDEVGYKTLAMAALRDEPLLSLLGGSGKT